MPVTSDPLRPSRLGTRGQALWDALSVGRDFDAATSVLVAECCRIADRLDRLNGILAGKGREWMSLAEQVDGEQVSIVMDAALSESRQQALALRTIFAQLGVGKLGDVASREVSALDQLAAARAARRSARPPASAHPDGTTGA